VNVPLVFEDEEVEGLEIGLEPANYVVDALFSMLGFAFS
jgi:hypothetical protein